ncbi:MAG: phosphatase PAP2 family protein [Firmicutes bacterium]|nr:phosphatase PAP2 family protein [Bacillota bacterium]
MTTNLNRKNSIIPSVVLFVVFIVYTVIVTVADVRPIGPYDSGVGLGTLNKAFAGAIGTHMFWYHITNVLGYLALIMAAFFAFVGVLQLVTRKSLKKVDRDIIILGCFYIVVLACYVLFDKFAINYRPVMMDGGLEASYPSSHTMLAICVFSTSILQLRWKMKDEQLSKIVQCVLAVFIVITVVGRLISGVHWLTDIIGGVLLSALLLSLYCWFVTEAGGPGYSKSPASGDMGKRRTGRGHTASADGAYRTRAASVNGTGRGHTTSANGANSTAGFGSENRRRSSRGRSHGRLDR